jgi:hypothetical protein
MELLFSWEQITGHSYNFHNAAFQELFCGEGSEARGHLPRIFASELRVGRDYKRSDTDA